jgi:uncharacterized protein YhfF
MKAESVEQFWARFCSSEPSVDAHTPYQVWYFGNTPQMASELAQLVLSGTKTATASSADMNELEPEKAPHLDGYSVVTDMDGSPLCIIRTVEARHVPFDLVDAGFAADEGEGDLSLEYWRRVHWDYFRREGERNGFGFDTNSIVCCERFRLVFPR